MEPGGSIPHSQGLLMFCSYKFYFIFLELKLPRGRF